MKREILTILMLWSVFSCSIQERGDLSVEKGCVTLKFQVVETAVTKGYMQVSEAVVSNLNVFVYNSEDKLSECQYYPDVSNGVSISFNMKEEAAIYILANVGDYTSDRTLKDVSAMQKLAWRFSEFSGMVGDDGIVPMSGKIDLRPFKNGEEVTVGLTRLIAKLRIRLDTTLLNKEVELFEVQKVSVCNVNSAIGFFSVSKAEDRKSIIRDGGSKEGNALSGLFAGGIDFYIPENAQGDLLPGNSDEKSHIPLEQYADLCTYIEILVKYRNKEHYNDSLVYRYYVHNGNMANFDVLRNTMYVCRTWFHGSGINENSWRIDISGMKDLVTSIEVVPADCKFTKAGEKIQLKANVFPVTAENNKVQWSSEIAEVATVAQDGTVTAVGDGTCKIMATATDGSGVSGSGIAVVDIYKYPQSVKITPEIAMVIKGDTLALTATVLPEAANDKGVIWQSSNRDVAVVTQDGVVCGINYGVVHIIATTKVGGLKDTANIVVARKTLNLTDFPKVLYPNYNTPYHIAYYANPPCTPVFSIQKLSGYDAVFLNDGIINAVNPRIKDGIIGKYKLSASGNDVNLEETFELSAGCVAMDKTLTTFYIGRTYSMPLSMLIPNDARIFWDISDNSVATIDADGKIMPLANGTCIIKATSVTGAYDESTIEVKTPEIGFSSYKPYLIEGKSWDFSKLLTLTTTRDLKIGYRIVQGNEYVTVDDNGVVKAIKRSGTNPVILEAYFVDIPKIFARVALIVMPAVSASLTGPDKIVNVGTQTVGADGDWSVFSTQTKVKKGSMSGNIDWEVSDMFGNRVETVTVSSDGTVNVINGYTNGTFYLTGWDVTHKYSTNPIKIEIYKLVEYELGVYGHRNYKLNPENIYYLTLYARWHNNSYRFLYPVEKSGLNLQKIISYSSNPDEYFEITASGSPFAIGIESSIPVGPNGEYLDNKVTLPHSHSYLRKSFTEEAATSGKSGQYYKMTKELNGFNGYLYIKQRNEKYYDVETGEYL